jgi:hypothetical protein
MRRCTVARCSSTCLHGLQVIITLPAGTSYRLLGNVRACLRNTQAWLHAIAAKSFFISMAHNPLRGMEHMLEPEPTSEAGRGPEPRDACQCWSPPRHRGGVQCRATRASARAFLGGEVGSRALGLVAMSEPSLSKEASFRVVGHVAARGRIPYLLPWLKACTWGYPVYRVPTLTVRRFSSRRTGYLEPQQTGGRLTATPTQHRGYHLE